MVARGWPRWASVEVVNVSTPFPSRLPARLRRIRLALPYRICYFDNVVIPEGGNRQKSREVGRMGTLRRASGLSVGVVMVLVTAGCGDTPSNQAAASPKPVIIGLITKTDANPFFVKMRQGAEREAAPKGAALMTGAGKDSSDAAGEATALENMVSASAKAILITPDSTEVTVAGTKLRLTGDTLNAHHSPN